MVFGVEDEMIIVVVTVTRTVTEPQRETEALLGQAKEDVAGLEVLQVGTEEGEVRDFTVRHKYRDSRPLHSDKKAFPPKSKMNQGRTSSAEIFDHNLPIPSLL